MSDERRFEARPYTKRESLLVGWTAIAFSVAIAGYFIVSGFDHVEQAVLILALSLAFAVYGAKVVRNAGKPVARQTVITSSEGVRIGEGPLIPWKQIDRLRATRGGVQLLGGGKRLGTISTDAGDAPEALGIVMKNIDVAMPSPRRVITARPTAEIVLDAIVFLVVAGAGLLIRDSSPILGWGAVPVALWLGSTTPSSASAGSSARE